VDTNNKELTEIYIQLHLQPMNRLNQNKFISLNTHPCMNYWKRVTWLSKLLCGSV